MFVKKFEAETLELALKQIKKELGPEAIILKTKSNKGVGGAFKKGKIEITAAIPEESYRAKSKVDSVLSDDQKETFYSSKSTAIASRIRSYQNNQTTQTQAGYGNLALNKQVKKTTPSELDQFLRTSPQPSNESSSDFDDWREDQLQATPMATESSASNVDDDELYEVISLLNRRMTMLENKLAESELKYKQEVNTEGNPLINQVRGVLQSFRLSESIISRLMKTCYRELTPDDLKDFESIFEFCILELEKMITVRKVTPEATHKKIVKVFISEVASGQSSCILKAASKSSNASVIEFGQMTEAKSLDLCAKILRIPTQKCSSLSVMVGEIRKSIESEKEVFVDLKASNQNEEEIVKVIQGIKRSFDQVDIFLTLSSLHDETYNRSMLEKYKSLCDATILTFLDQCISFGPLINLSVDYTDLPFAMFSSGGAIPDGLEMANAEKLISAILD